MRCLFVVLLASLVISQGSAACLETPSSVSNEFASEAYREATNFWILAIRPCNGRYNDGFNLEKMLPEKRKEIMARAAEFANNRLVAGMHFRSDIEMGQRSGTAIVAVLMNQDEFKKEYAGAEKELKTVLAHSKPSPVVGK